MRGRYGAVRQQAHTAAENGAFIKKGATTMAAPISFISLIPFVSQ